MVIGKPIKGDDVGVLVQLLHDLGIRYHRFAVHLFQGNIISSGLPLPIKNNPKCALPQEVPKLKVGNVNLITGFCIFLCVHVGKECMNVHMQMSHEQLLRKTVTAFTSYPLNNPLAIYRTRVQGNGVQMW